MNIIIWDSRCVAASTSGWTSSILWLSLWVLARQRMYVFSTSSVSCRYVSISRRIFLVEFLICSKIDCNFEAFSLYNIWRSFDTAFSASVVTASSTVSVVLLLLSMTKLLLLLTLAVAVLLFVLPWVAEFISDDVMYPAFDDDMPMLLKEWSSSPPPP